MGSNREEKLDEQEKLLIKEKQKKERSTSMSTRTRKIGRKLSRSMSIVALKIPEKANNILPRRLSKSVKHGDRSKKERTFDLAVIAPDKTQRQLSVLSSQKIHDVVSAILHEFGLGLPRNDEPPDSRPPPPQGYAMLFLGDSKAPVDPATSSGHLEGEILVVDVQPRVWDGADLDCFLEWERLFASTLFSAIELYGKPLLKAEIVSQAEYHLLFNYLQCVAEASNTLIERMGHYMEAGLLKNVPIQAAVEEKKDIEDKSILFELVQEGLLTKRDVELAGDGKEIQFQQWRNSAECPSNKSNTGYDTDLSSNRSSSSIPKIVLFSPDIANKGNRDNEDKQQEISKQCCDDHRISTGINDNLWANVRWEFMEENNVKQYLTTSIQDLNSNYDQVRSVKRSCSESTLGQIQYEDGIYESLENIKSSQHDITMTTPYESIEDLYDCIKKKSQYNSNEGDYHHSQDVSKGRSGSECTSIVEISSNLYENLRIVRECSVVSTQAESCVSFASSNTSCSKICDTSSESTNELSSEDYVSSFLRHRRVSACTNYDEKQSEHERENEILLKQLFHGDLMDVYNEYITSYRYAKGLLRTKVKKDEHFSALMDIRKGAAKFTIADYLELPIERLAQYERLVGASGAAGAGRRRATRHSDLERVQDLFPHDYLALHEHDATANAATAKMKTLLRKRPSLDSSMVGSLAQSNSPGDHNRAQTVPRHFLMEAPCQLASADDTSSPPNAQERHLFLFTDLLIVAKSRGANSFKLKECVRMSEVWISSGSGSGDTSFLLGWPTPGAGSQTATVANYRVIYPTQAARDTWLRKIQSALNTQMSLEPKSTNIQILYKDTSCSIEFCKTLSVTPEMSTALVIRQALQLLQNNNEDSPDSATRTWGSDKDFLLWAKMSRDSGAFPLQGAERPHAIQMSRIRQTLSNEEGFDLEHVNSKNNPCGMIFELRKKTQNNVKSVTGTGAGAGVVRTPLKLFRRASAGRLFGVSLPRLWAGAGGAAPPAVLALLRILRARAPHAQGVFRRSANAKALKALREKMDSLGPDCSACAELESSPVLLVASLLKDFLRSLPQALLCSDLYHRWINILGLPPSEKLSAVRSLLLKLPKSHYNLLSYFISLLQAIANKSAINLMCPMNLGVCVGPSILWPPTPCDKAPKAIPTLIEYLILNADTLFGPHIGHLLGKIPEPTNSMLDSGAEESDSVHSVGISLDSLDLMCPRKEKLSLSRDSGLTLSEDDSNSNGGNSPAPRNGLCNLTQAPNNAQTHQAKKVHARCYITDKHNVNGLPRISTRNNFSPHKQDIYGTRTEEIYPRMDPTEISDVNRIESSQHAYKSKVRNEYSHNDERHTVHKLNLYKTNIIDSKDTHIYKVKTPVKYVTGLEPEKPLRSNLSRTVRNAKVYSVNMENDNAEPTPRLYVRAKSSDDLLDKKQNSKSEKIKLQNANNAFMSRQGLDTPSYSRVYSGWEDRILNYANHNSRRNISTYPENAYNCLNNSLEESSNQKHCNGRSEAGPKQAATIFTRNDWTRQASRTKSLDVNAFDSYPQIGYSYEGHDSGNTYYSCKENNNSTYESSPKCTERRSDPSHMCSATCLTPNNCTNYYSQNNPHSYSPASEGKNTNMKLNGLHQSHRLHQINGHKLTHSKSLANIILHSDSSSSDTLYQPHQNYQSYSPASSENSYRGNNDKVQYSEPIYTNRNENLDKFCENIYGSNQDKFASDIYTAKPTSVQPDYDIYVSRDSDTKNNCVSRKIQQPPPVPPRKLLQQKALRKFPPVHVNIDKQIKGNTEKQITQDKVILDGSDTDTESESYV